MLPVLNRSRWQPSRRTAWGLLFVGLAACAVPTVWNAPLLADPPAGEPVLANPPVQVEGEGDVTLTNVVEFGDLFTIIASNLDEAAAQKDKAEKAARDAEAALAARNRDSRLEKLEVQLADLLKEVKSLRGGDAAATVHDVRLKSVTSPQQVLGGSAPKPVPPAKAAQANPAAPVYGLSSTLSRTPTVTRSPLWTIKTDVAAANEQVVLTRVTYKLPQNKASALESFLREHVKTSVLEMKVDGDAFVVTTTGDVQQGVGMLVNLMQAETKVRVRLESKPEPIEPKEAPKR